MGFRTVIIKKRSKLDVKLNYLVCRSDEETRVFIPEINTLILESTAISLTSALISELTKNGVKIIFCDEKHNPESELVSYYQNYNSSKKIKQQMCWNENVKQMIWSKIVKEKLTQQRNFLKELELFEEADLLSDYIEEVKLNDITNREGFGAKVYFNAIFGMSFSRRKISNINRALNYGYSILFSCFNREITKYGYLTQLGIWHKNEYNFFNLSSDLMEPFRVLVDRVAIDINEEDLEYKFKMLSILERKVKIGGKEQLLENAISIYCNSVFDALNKGDEQLILFYEL